MQRGGGPYPLYPVALAKAADAASTVLAMSSSLCAAPTMAASNCEGGQYTPAPSNAACHAANRFVSDAAASPHDRTGSLRKKTVSIEPMRCTRTTAHLLAAARTSPVSSDALVTSSRL